MFALQAVDVRMDERLLGRIFEMVQYISKIENGVSIVELLASYITNDDSTKAIQAAIWLNAVPQKDFDAEKLEMDEVEVSKRLRFEILQINPLQINLSFKVVGNFEVKRFGYQRIIGSRKLPIAFKCSVIERSLSVLPIV